MSKACIGYNGYSVDKYFKEKMTLELLLQQLEPLTYQDRVRYMIELGARANTDAQITETLNALETGDFSQRILALHSCYGSFDGALIIRALGDTSQGVRSYAMRLLALVADNVQVQIALNNATFKQRRYILKQLLRRRRHSCIDTFINNIANTDIQFGRLFGKFSNIVAAAIKNIISNRRILRNAVESLVSIARWKLQQMLPTVRAILEVLAEDSLTTCLQVKLAVCILPWDELATFFQQLASQGKMHAEAVLIAIHGIKSATSRNDANELVQLEQLLAPSEDENLRCIALTALITQSQVLGWNSERISRLYAFRNDTSPMVAEKAQFTFLPDTSVN